MQTVTQTGRLGKKGKMEGVKLWLRRRHKKGQHRERHIDDKKRRNKLSSQEKTISTFLSLRPDTWSTYSSWIMKAARLAV